MQPRVEFMGERRVYRTLPGDAPQACEGFAHHRDVVMRLALRGGAGMAGVAVAVIHDLDLGGPEMGAQQGGDAVGAGNRGGLAHAWMFRS